jgi:hypothetical protein
MSLYYLQGSADHPDAGHKHETTLLRRVILWLGIMGIITLSLFQGFGAFWSLERWAIHLMPKAWRPEPHKVILLQIDREDSGLNAMNVAMALRGLGKLHPSEIVLDGVITSDQETMPLLSDILARTGNENITVIQPSLPYPGALYRPVPLCRYDPPEWLGLRSDWKVLDGSLSNHGSGCFLATPSTEKKDELNLFAETKYGETIPSLWWATLTASATSMREPYLYSLWLFGGRIILLPNRSTLYIDAKGSAAMTAKESARMEHLDDFLLQMEQKERGVLSPGFDALWEHAMVVLGTDADLGKVAMLSALSERIFWNHSPFPFQVSSALLCVILVLLLDQQSRLVRLGVALLLLVTTKAGTIIAVRHGIIIPFLPPLLTALLLILPGSRSKSADH